jgi:hypothetical protein
VVVRNNLEPADAKVGGYYSELEDIVKVGYSDDEESSLAVAGEDFQLTLNDPDGWSSSSRTNRHATN